jgi:hypothetical protein
VLGATPITSATSPRHALSRLEGCNARRQLQRAGERAIAHSIRSSRFVRGLFVPRRILSDGSQAHAVAGRLNEKAARKKRGVDSARNWIV